MIAAGHCQGQEYTSARSLVNTELDKQAAGSAAAAAAIGSPPAKRRRLTRKQPVTVDVDKDDNAAAVDKEVADLGSVEAPGSQQSVVNSTGKPIATSTRRRSR